MNLGVLPYEAFENIGDVSPSCPAYALGLQSSYVFPVTDTTDITTTVMHVRASKHSVSLTK